MKRSAGLLAATGAAVLFAGVGGAAIAHADSEATGTFGYTHTSDRDHSALRNPEIGDCIQLDWSSGNATNNTNRMVTLFKGDRCTGDTQNLSAGRTDSYFHFRSVKFKTHNGGGDRDNFRGNDNDRYRDRDRDRNGRFNNRDDNRDDNRFNDRNNDRDNDFDSDLGSDDDQDR